MSEERPTLRKELGSLNFEMVSLTLSDPTDKKFYAPHRVIQNPRARKHLEDVDENGILGESCLSEKGWKVEKVSYINDESDIRIIRGLEFQEYLDLGRPEVIETTTIKETTKLR
jgi:hypothetical protein